jgi:Ca-activated chloride channel family protein
MNLAIPEWLLMWIAVPILAVGAVLLGRFTRRPSDEFAAERLRGKLVRRDHPLPRWLAFGMILAGICALVFALARPQGDAGVKIETSKGRNVMIALDLSRSMRTQDVKPDRLAQAKILIYELLETLESDRVGVIGFAGSSFLSAPLTIDHAAVRETVEQIDEEWVSVGGSDIASAIRLATETLKETGQKNNALIVISDGEEHEGDLDTIVADAERAGVTIFAIGVGTVDGGFVPHADFPGGFLVDRSGSKVLSRLQPAVMRQLANQTGGRYVIAGKGADIPAMVDVAIEGMDEFEMEGGKTRIVIEFFQWALLPGILFLMASIISGTRWRALSGTAAVIFLMMIPDSAQADRLDDAKEAFSKERFDQARDAYRSLAEEKQGNNTARYRVAEGLAAYEAQDYRGARQAYSGALLSEEDKVVGEAHEGMGNTLFQLGWMGLSGSRYPTDGDFPDMEQFDEMVREQLERMSQAEVPETGETNEFIRIDSIILNWADAVRHYRSAMVMNPDDQGPRRNEELSMKYLNRIAELLEEEKENAEQEIEQLEAQGQPQQGQGEGEPQEGEGDGESEDGEGSGGDGSGENGPGGENENDREGKGDKPDDKADEGDSGEEEGEGEDPNKSPEDRARDKLRENSDLEKGRPAQGRRDFSNPEKDW